MVQVEANPHQSHLQLQLKSAVLSSLPDKAPLLNNNNSQLQQEMHLWQYHPQ